jgi:hypothetical protein
VHEQTDWVGMKVVVIDIGGNSADILGTRN